MEDRSYSKEVHHVFSGWARSINSELEERLQAEIEQLELNLLRFHDIPADRRFPQEQRYRELIWDKRFMLSLVRGYE
ncbi:MAG: hypothetical protein HKM02_09985 [Pseudomonadales bacterium]|nr:hypothetical protein [Pseudomonadales bacterium]